MKKLYFFVVFVFLFNTITAHAPAPQEDQRLNKLHAIFKTLGTDIKKTYEAMNAYAQANWLRKPGQERWHMSKSQHQNKLTAIKPHLEGLGFINAIEPTQQNPDHVLLLGASVFRMRSRLNYLFQLINAKKINTKKITFLVSERPLDPAIEPESLMLDKKHIRDGWVKPKTLPKTEAEAAKFIWEQMQKPKDANTLCVEFVTTPMLTKNGKKVRANTADTLHTWFQQSPKVGQVVAISNNPYVPYQYETIKPIFIKQGWLKQGGTLEVVGEPASAELDVASLLDNVARYIYSILQTQKAQQAEK